MKSKTPKPPATKPKPEERKNKVAASVPVEIAPVTELQNGRRITITDVARHSGVSIATASKALNLPPETCPVNVVTRERVLRVAKELDYHPDWRGRALKGAKTSMIGVLYEDPYPWLLTGVGNLILGTFAVHLQEGGFHLQFVPAEENDQSWRRLLLDQRLDGCVAINQVPDFLAQAIADAQLPAVMLNLETKHPFPCILADDHDGARQVTRHLAQLGHRRILFFARASFGGRHFSHRERRNGYYQEMRAAGLAAHAQDVSCTIDELADSLQQPRQPGKGRTRATAVVTSENTEAVELINALWRRGLSVPHDVSVTTFNDIYPMAHLTPPVTTVRVPTDEIGAQGAAMLLRQIGSGQHQGPLRTVIPEVLVPRESSAAPRSSRTRY